MANDATITNKIVIEGEAKYKKALADINRSYRESKSALKAVTAEMAGNENSMTALTAQGDALQKVYDDQSAALKLMESHLEKVEAAYGKTSRQAVELRTKINNARAEMAKTGNELRELRSRLDQAADAMQDAERAADGVGDDLKGIGEGARDAEDDVGDLAQALEEAAGVDLGKLATGIGGIAAVKSGLELGEGVVDAWNQLAASTGATGEKLAQLKADAQAVANSGIGGDIGNVSQQVATVYQNTQLSGVSLQNCTKYAIALSDTFGMDVTESSRAAAQMMHTFGISGEEAYDLITVGAQNGANKNGNLLDTINEYSPHFHDAGKSAEEMFAAIIAGAQNGVYDVDRIGDSWKEMMLRITNGDEGAMQALSDLGFSATDVSHKIAGGGEAADLATQQIIQALARTEDPYEQNRLSVALFGTQWEDVAGAVLPAFQNMEGGLDNVTGAAQGLVDVKYNDLSTSWDALKNKLYALAEPALLTGVNAVNEALDRMGTAVTAFSEGDWQGGLLALAGPQQMSEELAAQSEAAQTASADLREELAQLDTAINEAFASGDNKTGWTLSAQREQLLAEIIAAEQEAVAAMDTMGGNMATALSETSVEMETAAQTVGDAAVEATEDAQPDMMDAGKGMGTSETLGFKAGAQGMRQAGVNAAQGAVSGARSMQSALYAAGSAAAQAYRSGFQRTLEIRSPSRAAMEDMAYVTEGYEIQAQRDRERVRNAGEALGEAVRSGMGESPMGGAGALHGAYSGSDGLTAEAIAEATARAISGMGLYVGRDRAGEILEAPVSEATQRRRLGTVKGLSTAAKSW